MDENPILICYDGSEGAQRAIDAAAALLGSRRAVVVDIGPPMTRRESIGALSPVTAVGLLEQVHAKDALAQAAEGALRAQTAGFSAEARAEVAAPTWEAICGLADELDAAAIVIGSRGLTGPRAVVAGSVSHEVAEHAGRPVLIVPPARQGSH